MLNWEQVLGPLFVKCKISNQMGPGQLIETNEMNQWTVDEPSTVKSAANYAWGWIAGKSIVKKRDRFVESATHTVQSMCMIGYLITRTSDFEKAMDVKTLCVSNDKLSILEPKERQTAKELIDRLMEIWLHIDIGFIHCSWNPKTSPYKNDPKFWSELSTNVLDPANRFDTMMREKLGSYYMDQHIKNLEKYNRTEPLNEFKSNHVINPSHINHSTSSFGYRLPRPSLPPTAVASSSSSPSSSSSSSASSSSSSS